MSKFIKLLEATMVRFQRSAFLTGDPITFKKGWEKNDWVRENPDYANKIQEFIASGDTLRISATKAWPTSVQGSYGNYENELANLADITRETAPGLYIDFMTVPTKLLQRVDTGINLSKVPDSKRRKDTTQIKPIPADAKKAKKGEINYSQERQTGIGENDDRHLHNVNTVLPHSKRWNMNKPGGGNMPKIKLHKFRESVSLNKNDESCIFEAYKHMYIESDTESKQSIVDIEHFKRNYIQQLQNDTWNFRDEFDPQRIQVCGSAGEDIWNDSLKDCIDRIQKIKTLQDIENVYKEYEWDSVYSFSDFINEIINGNESENIPDDKMLEPGWDKSTEVPVAKTNIPSLEGPQ